MFRDRYPRQSRLKYGIGLGDESLFRLKVGGIFYAAPTITAPTGVISDTTPDIEFTLPEGATSATVRVYDASETLVFEDTEATSPVTVSPALDLGDGPFRVEVNANPNGAVAEETFDYLLLLLRVEYSTNDASPVASPYAGELGSLNLTDTGALFSVVGGEAVSSALATSTGARDPMWMTATSWAREAGRALLMGVKRHAAGGNNSPYPGWSVNAFPGASSSHGLIFQSSLTFGVNALTLGSAVAVVVGNFNNETYYDVAIVLRSTGVYCFVDGVLLWVGDIGTESNLFGSILPIAAGRSVYDLDYMRIADIPVLAEDLRTVADASPADDETWTGEADCVIDFEFTTPATFTEPIWLYYRWNEGGGNGFRFGIDTSDSNRWKVQSLTGGTPTNLISPGVSAGTSTAYKFRVKVDGQSHGFYIKTAGAWAQIGMVTTSALYTAQTGMKLEIGAGYASVQNLSVWPVRQPRYNALPNS